MEKLKTIAMLFGMLGMSLLIILLLAVLFDVKGYFAHFMQKHPRIQIAFGIVLCLGVIVYCLVSLLNE